MIPNEKNSGKSIVYVTRELERALGMAPNANYIVVTNKTRYGETVKAKYPEYVTLIDPNADGDRSGLLGTGELLAHPITREIISGNNAQILVFKNTLRVEAVITGNGWNVLNPKSSVSERVENKLSQIRWLGTIGTQYLPSHTTKIAKYITWKNDPFILQWAHGHTGDGTMLIRTSEELKALQDKFPERMARLTSYIKGPSFTVNAIVTPERILAENVSYQITGLSPFTDNEFSTVGNDWGVAQKLLTQSDLVTIQSLVQEIGKKLQADGWRGLFGVDFIRDEAHKKIYLIEVNARQPASTTFESSLQEEKREKGAVGLTTFEAHIRALEGLPISEDLITIDDGAQVIQRVTKHVEEVFDDVGVDLEKKDYNVVSYENSAPNADLLRIQSHTSIMEGHGTFNVRGKEILEAIKSSHFNIKV